MSKKQWQWYEPEDASHAIDTIENIQSIIGFISDAFSQNTTETHLSEVGFTGLYFLLSFIEGKLGDCVKLLVKEG